MASLTSRHGGSWLPEPVEDLGRRALGKPRERRGMSTGLLVTGVVIVGMGVFTWKYLGPDLKRYLKIHSM